MIDLTIVVYKSRTTSTFYVLAKSKELAQADLDQTDAYSDLVYDQEITLDEARQLGCGLIDDGIFAIAKGDCLGYMIASPEEEAHRQAKPPSDGMG